MRVDLEKLASDLRHEGERYIAAADALDGRKKPQQRVISKEGRARIAAAQRTRWAKVRKANKAA